MAHVDAMLLRFVVETPGRDAAGNEYSLFSLFLFANIKYNTNYNNNKTFGSSPGSNLLI